MSTLYCLGTTLYLQVTQFAFRHHVLSIGPHFIRWCQILSVLIAHHLWILHLICRCHALSSDTAFCLQVPHFFSWYTCYLWVPHCIFRHHILCIGATHYPLVLQFIRTTHRQWVPHVCRCHALSLVTTNYLYVPHFIFCSLFAVTFRCNASAVGATVYLSKHVIDIGATNLFFGTTRYLQVPYFPCIISSNQLMHILLKTH